MKSNRSIVITLTKISLSAIYTIKNAFVALKDLGFNFLGNYSVSRLKLFLIDKNQKS